jgi:uncharacterized protein (TIGR02271 family)
MNALNPPGQDPVAGDKADPDRARPEGLAIPVIEEVAQLAKREVDAGGYRITKTVQHREETIDEALAHQRVLVERKPIGRQLLRSELPEPRYEGDVLIVPVVEEVLVVEKRLVLVEEVHIVRVQGTHRNPRTVRLRKEEISIERLGPEQHSDVERS